MRHTAVLILALAWTGLSSLVATDLQVVFNTGERRLPLVGAEPNRILVRDGQDSIPVPEKGNWSLEGDWEKSALLFDWLTDYTIARPRKPDAQIDPERPIEVMIPVRHRRSISRDGTFQPGQVLTTWPEGLTESAAVVFVWIVGNDIAHVEVLPMAAPEDYLEFVIRGRHQISRAAAPHCRAGVAAVIEGRFVRPRAAFPAVGELPVVEALLFDDPTRITAAIAADAIKDWRDLRGRPFIVAAAQLGATHVLEHLLAAHPAEIRTTWSETGDSPLHIAALYGRDAAVKRLIDRATLDTQNKDLCSPLHLAAWHSHATTVRVLLEAGARVVERGKLQRRVVAQAIDTGDIVTAGILRDADTSELPLASSLVFAAEAGQTEMVRWIAQHGDAQTVPQGGNSAMYYAVAKQGDAATVRVLLEAGAPVNARDQHGDTALHAACRRHDIPIATELLSHSADANARDHHGETPLHYVAVRNHASMTLLLLEHRGDATVENHDGLQPLECALLAGAVDAARAFSEAGVHLDLLRSQAVRALEAAIAMDVDVIVAQVLARGWSVDRELRPGWTALAIADLCGSNRVAGLLREAGGTSAGSNEVNAAASGTLDAPPRIIVAPAPEDPRPDLLRTGSLQWIVDLVIAPDGAVLFPRLRQHPDNFDPRGVLAVFERWRFASPQRNGQPVATQVAIPINFRVKASPAMLLEVDELPRLSNRVEIAFPRAVTSRREFSAVTIRMIVAANGKPEAPQVVQEIGGRFRTEALAAIRQWEFKPARKNGEAVPVTLEFTLDWTP